MNQEERAKEQIRNRSALEKKANQTKLRNLNQCDDGHLKDN